MWSWNTEVEFELGSVSRFLWVKNILKRWLNTCSCWISHHLAHSHKYWGFGAYTGTSKLES